MEDFVRQFIDGVPMFADGSDTGRIGWAVSQRSNVTDGMSPAAVAKVSAGEIGTTDETDQAPVIDDFCDPGSSVNGKREKMEHNQALISLATKDASNDVSCFWDPVSNSRKLSTNPTGWMTHRRHVSLPLARRVASIMREMSDGACVVRRGVILEHAPGTRNPVTWVDCLAVSAFGVFVIDQYDWMGTVTRSTNDDELLVRESSGVVCARTSPLRRAKPALRHLRPILGEYGCPIDGIAVFADLYCTLDPTLPETLLQVSELRHFMRTRLNHFRGGHFRYLDARMIATQVQSRCADWGRG